jgi:hypothetical protein
MSSPEEAKSIFVTVEVPSVEQLSDDNLAALAHMRDGRWSAQTKALLKRFGTGKLDLNSGWASTWTLWSCPCCRREKAQIARLSGSGVLLCRLEFHHDHLADFAKRIFSEHNQRSEDQETNIQIGRAKDALMLFVERFERTLICIDCNLAEGRAKLELAKEIDSNFTFSPSQIASFIGVAPNRVHSIDIEKARAVWLAAKDDVADRLDFTARMAQRIASGRHRREVAAGRRLFAQIQERDLIYSLFSRAAPDGYGRQCGKPISNSGRLARSFCSMAHQFGSDVTRRGGRHNLGQDVRTGFESTRQSHWKFCQKPRSHCDAFGGAREGERRAGES